MHALQKAVVYCLESLNCSMQIAGGNTAHVLIFPGIVFKLFHHKPQLARLEAQRCKQLEHNDMVVKLYRHLSLLHIAGNSAAKPAHNHNRHMKRI